MRRDGRPEIRRPRGQDGPRCASDLRSLRDACRQHLGACVLMALVLTAGLVRFAQGFAQPRFPIIESGYIGRSGGAGQELYWLDNDRLLFLAEKPQERAPNDISVPDYNLYVWDLRSKTVKLHRAGSQYSGLCVFKGYVRFTFTEQGRRFIFEGPFGSERLRYVDQALAAEFENHEREVNRHTCREYKTADLPPKGWRVYPLLDGEFLSRDREPKDGEVVHLRYWPRDLAPVLLNMTAEVTGVSRYSDYVDAYVLSEAPFNFLFGSDVVRRSWLMDRRGRIRDFTPPSGPWMRGTTYVAPTRRGLFLISHAVGGGGNGDAGAYLLRDGELIRIIEGLPSSFAVSPNGCRVAVLISDVSRFRPDTAYAKALDLCS